MHDMKVLALRADAGGCAFYRMYEPARVVQEQFNIEVKIDNHLPIEAYIANNGDIDIRNIRIDRDIDLVICQRPMLKSFMPAIRKLQRMGVAVIVEIDDNMSQVDRGNLVWANVQPETSPASNWKNLEACTAIADLVTVSTPALATRYAPHGRFSVIRNCVPKSIFERAKKIPDDPRVGWTGTIQTHPRDLDEPGVHVGVAVNRWGTEFRVVGDGHMVREKLGIPEHVPVEATGWVPVEDYYGTVIDNVDIGIVPLAPTIFNAGKSYLKGLEYAALGIPFVASPTPEYRVLAEQGVGVLATKERDWQKHLKQLLTNRDLLLERSDTYRERVSTLTYENHAEEWVSAWLQAIKNRRTNSF